MDRSTTEVNTDAWEGAEKARRTVQRGRTVRALGNTDDLPESFGKAASHVDAERAAAKTAQDARHADLSDSKVFTESPDRFEPGSIEHRLHTLGEEHIAQQMHRRLIGSQAPEPVMEVIGPDKGEGAKVASRVWAVDDEEFNKKAGDEMTDAEYESVCRRMKPVHWDEDGEPDMWAPAHDRIADDESLNRSVPTRREREQAKQYAVRGLASKGMGGEHIRDTDHTILPDPYVEPIDPDLP